MPRCAFRFWTSQAPAILVALLFVRGVAGYAQVDTGVVLGTITDASGSVVPEVPVTLTNQETGILATRQTGPDGRYIFTPVKIGNYTVAAEKTGFRKVEVRNVRVDVEQQVKVDLTLTVGALTQTVEVKSAAPLLQTQEASVGQVVGTNEINDLPLNGRNFTFLARLSPGVVTPQPSGYGLENTGSFNANGIRLEENNYILDGVDNNYNAVTYEHAVSFVALPPIDALQEFRIETSNFSAETGRGGAVLNATTKSGTNQIHGDVWEFLRNDKLDAANFFENSTGQLKGEFRQNQFGFTLGGPIRKDKTFFFVDYQGTRVRQATPYVTTVPTASERASGYTDLSELISGQSGASPQVDILNRSFPLGTVFDPATTRNINCGVADPVSGITPSCPSGAAAGSSIGFAREPFAGNQLPAGRLDPNAIKLLNLYPTPTAPGLFSNFSSDPLMRDTLDQFDARVDHNFSAKDQMFGRFTWQGETKVLPGPFTGLADGGSYTNGTFDITDVSAVWSETHTFSPTLINEFRLGYSRDDTNQLQPFGNTLGIPQQYGISGVPQLPKNGGLPYFIISGLNSLGAAYFMPEMAISETYELNENLTKIYGGHTLKGGFEYQRIRYPWLGPWASRGQFQYDGVYTEVPNTGGGSTGLAQMLVTPTPTSVPNGFDDTGGMDAYLATNFQSPSDRRRYYAGYFNDTWKATRKLTVNLGLRWEYTTPTIEQFGAQANFVPGTPGSGAEFLIPSKRQNTPLSPSFRQFLQTDGINLQYSNLAGLLNNPKTNFGPRIGLAYQLKPKLVARAAYGIFYESVGGYGGYPDLGANYPFLYTFNFYSPDPGHPITFSDGSIATLENGMSGTPLNPAFVNAQFLSLEGWQHNSKAPSIQEYNVTLQYQVTPSQSFQIAYIGNSSHHLVIPSSANAVSEILPPGLNPQNYVPFPDFGRSSSYNTTNGSASYNSLQTSFERRFSKGLNFLADFTWSKCLTDGQDILVGATNPGFRAPYLPHFGVQGDYAPCAFDIPHVVHVSGTYELPFGAGKHFLAQSSKGVLNQIVGGWKTNVILTLQDGDPFNIGCPNPTTAAFGCAALLTGQSITAGPHDVNQWINPAAFAQPPVATATGQTDYAPLGGRPFQARAPGFHRLDLSFFKQFRTTESTRLEFRAEFFNFTNTPQFGFPAFTNFNNPSTFGQIFSTIDGAFDQRQIQLALKFYW